MKAIGIAVIIGLLAISTTVLIMTHAASRELPIAQVAPPPVINLPEEPVSKPVPVVKVTYAHPTKRISPARAKPVVQPKVVEIRVVVASQRLFATLSNKKVREFLCSTADTSLVDHDGKSFVTEQYGRFKIIKKDANHWSQLWDCPMAWSLFYTPAGRAIHATEAKNYSSLGRQPASHGCVRVSEEDARWLYQHTPLGTPVSVE